MSKLKWINIKFKTLDCADGKPKTDAEEFMCNIGQLVFWSIVCGVLLAAFIVFG